MYILLFPITSIAFFISKERVSFQWLTSTMTLMWPWQSWSEINTLWCFVMSLRKQPYLMTTITFCYIYILHMLMPHEALWLLLSLLCFCCTKRSPSLLTRCYVFHLHLADAVMQSKLMLSEHARLQVLFKDIAYWCARLELLLRGFLCSQK